MGLKVLKPRLAVFDARRIKPPKKVADAFYLSPEWRALIAEIIRERGRRCEDAKCPTPNGPWGRIYGDHIIELRDGGRMLDKRNVKLRCHTCHARKTVSERARRATGSSPSAGEA